MQPQRAAAFFAKRVVLVEGPTELALYSYLVDRGRMSTPAPGIMFLDCMGKYNLHRFVALLGKFGIDHSVLYDGDNGKALDAEVSKTVADSHNSFTKHVVRLTGDIETELGINPLAKSKANRKPQYLIYHFEAQLLDQKKVDGVISILEDLCTKSESIDPT